MSGWRVPLRTSLFGALEWLSHLRRPAAEPVIVGQPGQGRHLWVYVTTIGELNAVEAWLHALLRRLGNPPLVLLSNHAHYQQAYLRKFPQAVFVAFDGAISTARQLLRQMPPLLLAVAEIPCVPHDAPCRFSYATLRLARKARAPRVLVNGWLYGDQPSSRMDVIERAWFERDYVQAFDLCLVQTDEVRNALLALGARAERVLTTGNLKYDALRAAAAHQPTGPLGAALRAYAAGPVVVAGSVTETEDQHQMIQAFVQLLAVQPAARLVLAPRHPENLPRMQALRQLLAESGLGHAFRSQLQPQQALDREVLVLDTMGELGECYAGATWAFVGTDHNVLEPLAYGKPVYVSGNWKPVYPSYPVYVQALGQGLITHVPQIQALGAVWAAGAAHVASTQAQQQRRVDALIAGDQGRVDRNLDLMFKHLPLREARAP